LTAARRGYNDRVTAGRPPGATAIAEPDDVALPPLPLRPGVAGEPVRDLQQRLAASGFATVGDEPGVYGADTVEAVRRFQASRGLRVDGVCGIQSWSSLVEAGYRLGDRFLYLRSPMVRGDDVAELQRLLGALGFDAGRVDGIFGPRTADALGEFQRNAGLTTDGICGTATVTELRRLTSRSDDDTVARVREAERLRGAPRQLLGRRLAVGESGGLAVLADAVERALSDAGAIVAVLHHPDETVQAEAANRFEAEAFVGLVLTDEAGCRAAFYANEGFESVGGRRLAELAVAELSTAATGFTCTAPIGMRLPVLRETRMPAIVCELGPPQAVVEHAPDVVVALTRAITNWVESPLRE
jgi:N-acetylmuramoyl-L-alanine amidase